MFRKFILKLVFQLYLSRNREIVKLAPEQEFNKFLFKTPDAVLDLLRTYLTRSTLTYWEAKSDYERNVEKGGALMLRLFTDLHKAACEADKEKIPQKKIIKFVNLKNNLLAEITNQKTQ